MSWLTALKILPWADMLEYAPHVVGGAQKLWQRVRNQRADSAVVIDQTAARVEDPAQQIQALQQDLEDLRAQQIELSNLINELAAQNQRLVSAVDVLRTRTRILLVSSAILGGICIYLLVPH